MTTKQLGLVLEKEFKKSKKSKNEVCKLAGMKRTHQLDAVFKGANYSVNTLLGLCEALNIKELEL